jgi:hypothetical protein
VKQRNKKSYIAEKIDMDFRRKKQYEENQKRKNESGYGKIKN